MTVHKEQVEKTAKAAQKKAMDAGQAVGEAAKTAAAKAKEGIMAFGNTVANKSRELMETAKLNAQKSQKQRELEESYKELGEMAYAKGRLRGEMGEMAKRIKELYTELQQIEVAINAAQSTKECKNCGLKHYVGDNYCPNCGAKQ